MWGRGIYFAQDASYSDAYSHKYGNGLHGMFLARVLIGQAETLASNNNIVEPSVGYDSVTGTTNGSKVFIIYANKKAYPQYYVTYRK